MKKAIISALIFGSAVIALPAVEARGATSAPSVSEPQVRVQIGRNRRWNNRRVRTVTRTRITRIGFRTYRETIRTTYLPNGRTRTQVISRVRIRG
jgi:hypothetical protein